MRITSATTVAGPRNPRKARLRGTMRLTVNAEEHDLAIAGHETLLTVLRDRLQLTGTKRG